MCTAPNCNDPFHGLEDDLDAVELTDADRAITARTVAGENARMGAAFTEACPSCRGRGRFISYAGRDCGPCFKCKGAGKLSFKSSPEQRAKGRDTAARAAARKVESVAAQVEAFKAEHAADYAWIVAKGDSFDFANSMRDALLKYGALTEKQHAAVTRLRLSDEARTAVRAVEAQARAANAPVVDAGRIEQAFATAQSKGVKKPRMVLNGLKFSMAPAHGRNAGALYVVRKDDDQYLGKIQDGRFSRVRECDADTEAKVVAVVNDPKGEALAYGRRTGNCCICNRELTNHASIDAGIGPICAERFGW